MTKAWRKTIRDIAIIVLIGIAYYVFYSLTGIGIPCAIREVTGYPCPSCGVTHMVLDMTRLDFESAFKDNQFLFITWPVIVAEIVYMLYTIESGRDLSRKNVIGITVFTVLLFAFGIIRICFSL